MEDGKKQKEIVCDSWGAYFSAGAITIILFIIMIYIVKFICKVITDDCGNQLTFITGEKVYIVDDKNTFHYGFTVDSIKDDYVVIVSGPGQKPIIIINEKQLTLTNGSVEVPKQRLGHEFDELSKCNDKLSIKDDELKKWREDGEIPRPLEKSDDSKSWWSSSIFTRKDTGNEKNKIKYFFYVFFSPLEVFKCKAKSLFSKSETLCRVADNIYKSIPSIKTLNTKDLDSAPGDILGDLHAIIILFVKCLAFYYSQFLIKILYMIVYFVTNIFDVIIYGLTAAINSAFGFTGLQSETAKNFANIITGVGGFAASSVFSGAVGATTGGVGTIALQGVGLASKAVAGNIEMNNAAQQTAESAKANSFYSILAFASKNAASIIALLRVMVKYLKKLGLAPLTIFNKMTRIICEGMGWSEEKNSDEDNDNSEETALKLLTALNDEVGKTAEAGKKYTGKALSANFNKVVATGRNTLKSTASVFSNFAKNESLYLQQQEEERNRREAARQREYEEQRYRSRQSLYDDDPYNGQMQYDDEEMQRMQQMQQPPYVDQWVPQQQYHQPVPKYQHPAPVPAYPTYQQPMPPTPQFSPRPRNVQQPPPRQPAKTVKGKAKKGRSEIDTSNIIEGPRTRRAPKGGGKRNKRRNHR